MIESLLVYLTLYAIMAFCGVRAARREPSYVPYSGKYVKNNMFLQPEIMVIIAVFTIIFGCRWGVGVDFFHYLYSYTNGFHTLEHYEPLFKGISSFMSNKGLHYAIFFGFWALVEISLLYLSLKKYPFIFPALAFYLIFGTYFMSMMNVIRQQVAACIFLYSFQYIENKKILPYYLCVLIAFLVHRSALLLIVIYPILHFRDDWFKNIPIQLIIYAACVFLSFRYSTLLQWVETPFRWFGEFFGYEDYGYGVLGIDRYNDRTQFGNNSGLGIFTQLIKSIPIIIMSKDLKKYYNSRFFNNLYTLWFIAISIGLAVSSSIILYRPFVYFANIQAIMLAFVTVYCLKSKNIVKQSVAVVFILLHIAMFLNVLSNGAVNTSLFVFFWQA